MNQVLCELQLPSQLDHLLLAIPVCITAKEQTTLRFIQLRENEFAEFETMLRSLERLQREADYAIRHLDSLRVLHLGISALKDQRVSDKWRATTASLQPKEVCVFYNGLAHC